MAEHLWAESMNWVVLVGGFAAAGLVGGAIGTGLAHLVDQINQARAQRARRRNGRV